MACYWILSLAFLAGVHSASLSDRIYGGNPATVEQYPSIVQVEIITPIVLPTWTYGCGASIITNFHLVSAAHCFDLNNIQSERRIRAGATQRITGGIIINIENAFNHPSYGTNGMDGDISVVKLLSPLVWSNVIQPIAIIQQGAVLADNQPVVYAGWGVTENNSQAPALLAVNVFTVNHALCTQRYAAAAAASPVVPAVTNNMICAGILDIPGFGPCNSDSGGPLYYNSNNANILVGVTSFGNGCGSGEYPSVVARVSSYTNWIIATAV